MIGKNLKQLGLQQAERYQGEKLCREILQKNMLWPQTVDQICSGNRENTIAESMKGIEDNTGSRWAGGIIFHDAPGGTRKTYLINLLLAKIRQSKNKMAVVVALSGMASTLPTAMRKDSSLNTASSF
jgi:hypothetical protein